MSHLKPWVTEALVQATVRDLRYIEQVAHDYRVALQGGRPSTTNLQDLEHVVAEARHRIDAARTAFEAGRGSP